jgi:hypothetical protein
MLRPLLTAQEMRARGLSSSKILRGARAGKWHRVHRGVYVLGTEPPTPLETAVGLAVATGGVASCQLAAVLLGLDGVRVRIDVAVGPTGDARRPGVRRRRIAAEHIVLVGGIRCTDGLQTLVDLAGELDDDRWEQALESALRQRLLTIGEVGAAAVGEGAGAVRTRRVLGRRPVGAPPTESLLETLMVQLVRTVPGLPTPARQVEVHDAYGRFVARVDLAWPEIGLFVELDGQHHKGQPEYDASRETAIVAATGWLCGRFLWADVVYHPRPTARRLAELVAQASRRQLWR